ncbi:MAG: hypothetical protein QM648_06240 [Solirubrobacterales bacterium]
MGASEKLAEKLDPIAQSLVTPSEELRGVIATTSAKVYGGKTFVVVVTDKRLVIQPTSSTWVPTGDSMTLRPHEIEEYEIRGWSENALRGPLKRFSEKGFRVNIKTTDDRPFELMGWTGGKLGGGERQAAGVAALRAWLDAIDFDD